MVISLVSTQYYQSIYFWIWKYCKRCSISFHATNFPLLILTIIRQNDHKNILRWKMFEQYLIFFTRFCLAQLKYLKDISTYFSMFEEKSNKMRSILCNIYIKSLSNPLPFYANQIIDPFLIQGSQPITIDNRDFSPSWNKYTS